MTGQGMSLRSSDKDPQCHTFLGAIPGFCPKNIKGKGGCVPPEWIRSHLTIDQALRSAGLNRQAKRGKENGPQQQAHVSLWRGPCQEPRTPVPLPLPAWGPLGHRHRESSPLQPRPWQRPSSRAPGGPPITWCRLWGHLSAWLSPEPCCLGWRRNSELLKDDRDSELKRKKN